MIKLRQSIDNITYHLRQWDPGLLHSRQASRTVLSVIVTALLLYHAPFVMKFMGCFAAGSVQQGLIGYRKNEIRIAMLISSGAMLLYYFICAAFSQSILLTNINLIIGAFFVFYVRRFGPRYSLFPMFVWLMGFSSTVFMKHPDITTILGTGFTIAIGLTIAIIIRFWILPDIRAQQFASNLLAFFDEVRLTLKKIQYNMLHEQSIKVLDAYLHELKIRLRQLFIQNEGILTLSYGKNNVCDQKLFYYLHCQYNAGKSLVMLMTNLIHLKKLQKKKAFLFDDSVKNLMHASEKKLTTLKRTLHPVIEIQPYFSVRLEIKQSSGFVSAMETMMQHRRTQVVNEMVLILFQYHYNMEHFIGNLTDFGKSHG